MTSSYSYNIKQVRIKLRLELVRGVPTLPLIVDLGIRTKEIQLTDVTLGPLKYFVLKKGKNIKVQTKKTTAQTKQTEGT